MSLHKSNKNRLKCFLVVCKRCSNTFIFFRPKSVQKKRLVCLAPFSSQLCARTYSVVTADECYLQLVGSCNTLQHTATYCNILQQLQHAATSNAPEICPHSSDLQKIGYRMATTGRQLQHTATRCITLQQIQHTAA